MRLKTQEIEIIVQLTKKYFSEEAEVFLFGSRIFDTKKGGDIDLFINSTNKDLLNTENKFNFIVALKKSLGDRKIDIVLENNQKETETAYYKSIKATMQPLHYDII